MGRVYSEEFHEFIETYGELLDQVENARDALEIIQEEVSSRFDDLNAEMEETLNLLQTLEKQVWQFRSRTEACEPVVTEHNHIDHEDGSSFMSDLADVEDPFADMCKS